MTPPLKLPPARPHSIASTRPEPAPPGARHTYQVRSTIHDADVYVRFVGPDRGHLTEAERRLISTFHLPLGRAVLLVDYAPRHRAYLAVARDPLSLSMVAPR